MYLNSKLFKSDSGFAFNGGLRGVEDFEAIHLLGNYLHDEGSFVINDIRIVNGSRPLKLHDNTVSGIDHEHASRDVVVTNISTRQVHSHAVKAGLDREFFANSS